jgi:hypothetical protein
MTPEAPRKPRLSRCIWPELFESTPLTERAVENALAAGEIRALGLGLYTCNFADEPAKILDRHCQQEQDALRDRLMKLSVARALIYDPGAHTLDEVAALIRGSTERRST